MSSVGILTKGMWNEFWNDINNKKKERWGEMEDEMRGMPWKEGTEQQWLCLLWNGLLASGKNNSYSWINFSVSDGFCSWDDDIDHLSTRVVSLIYNLVTHPFPYITSPILYTSEIVPSKLEKSLE